jgi:hypothetical protein
MSVVVPQAADPIVDKDGKPTAAFHTFLVNLVGAVNALQVTVDDHESRLTALEP